MTFNLNKIQSKAVTLDAANLKILEGKKAGLVLVDQGGLRQVTVVLEFPSIVKAKQFFESFKA